MKTWAREIKESSKLRWNGIYNFHQKILIHLEVGQYILKTVTNHSELIETLRLRHEVFYREFKNINKEGLDVDRFDSHFDHLIIIHKESNTIIGTYRISCTSYSQMSYTGLEFNLDQITRLQGPHIELGRACIKKDFRKSASVISLLWRGITEYMNATNANILFGCTSVKTEETRKAALIYSYLFQQDAVCKDTISVPQKKYLINDLDIWLAYFSNGLSEQDNKEAEALIPPLLKSYIKFGAKIASEPAIDKEFNCIDFLTLMKKEDMAHTLTRRFQILQ